MKNDITKIQSRLAIASFSCGVIIASICLFWIEPIGEITSSAISIVSEMLVLCGALLGIKTSFDIRMKRFEGEIEDTRKEIYNNRRETTERGYSRDSTNEEYD